jgi:hypothetical protein
MDELNRPEGLGPCYVRDAVDGRSMREYDRIAFGYRLGPPHPRPPRPRSQPRAPRTRRFSPRGRASFGRSRSRARAPADPSSEPPPSPLERLDALYVAACEAFDALVLGGFQYTACRIEDGLLLEIEYLRDDLDKVEGEEAA